MAVFRPSPSTKLTKNNFGLLPLTVDDSAAIDAIRLARLSTTAAANAGSKGAWRELDVALVWTATVWGQLSCYAWEVPPPAE